MEYPLPDFMVKVKIIAGISIDLNKSKSYRYYDLLGTVRHQLSKLGITTDMSVSHAVIRQLYIDGEIERVDTRGGFRYRIPQPTIVLPPPKAKAIDFVYIMSYKYKKDKNGIVVKRIEGRFYGTTEDTQDAMDNAEARAANTLAKYISTKGSGKIGYQDVLIKSNASQYRQVNDDLEEWDTGTEWGTPKSKPYSKATLSVGIYDYDMGSLSPRYRKEVETNKRWWELTQEEVNALFFLW